jgi:hypothetical protein
MSHGTGEPWKHLDIALHYSPHQVMSSRPEEIFQKIVLKSRVEYCMEVSAFSSTVLRGRDFAPYSAGQA